MSDSPANSFRFPKGHRRKPEPVVVPEQWLDEAVKSGRPLAEVWQAQLRSHGGMGVAVMKSMARFALTHHWDGKCAYCRTPFGEPPTLDHVTPKTLDGDDSFENFVPACMKCNSSRNDRSCEAFLKSIGKTSKEIAEFEQRLSAWRIACEESALRPAGDKVAAMQELEASGLFREVFQKFGWNQGLYFGRFSGDSGQVQ